MKRLRRFWCCNTRIGRPHRDGCAFKPVGPIDYLGPAVVLNQTEEEKEVLEPGDIPPWERHR